jgi:hypothetical protein
MVFAVSATKSGGRLTTASETLREAVALAMERREQGYSEIKITDLTSGEVMDEERIVALEAGATRPEGNA